MSEGIHIKKKNRGKFTATKKRTGKSTEELTHSKNPLTRKRAIFAQNARKWNHKKKRRLTEGDIHKIVRSVIRCSLLESGRKYVNESFRGEIGLQKASDEIRKNFQIAKEMKELGKDEMEIKLATGWEIGFDGKWKYEESDGEFKEVPVEEIHTLYDMWDDEDLYQWYPELKNATITIANGDGGNYASSAGLSIQIPKDVIYWCFPRELPYEFLKHNAKSTIVHEIQHCIQHLELWEGGRPGINYAYIGKEIKNINKQIDYLQALDVQNYEDVMDLYKKSRDDDFKRRTLFDLMHKLYYGYTKEEHISDLEKDLDRLMNANNDEYYNSNGEKEAYAAGNRIKLTKQERLSSLMRGK